MNLQLLEKNQSPKKKPQLKHKHKKKWWHKVKRHFPLIGKKFLGCEYMVFIFETECQFEIWCYIFLISSEHFIIHLKNNICSARNNFPNTESSSILILLEKTKKLCFMCKVERLIGQMGTKLYMYKIPCLRKKGHSE